MTGMREITDTPEQCEAQGPEISVERGQPLIVIVHFESDPSEIYFSYLRPGESRPVVDDGFGQPRSKIEHIGPGIYRYTFSTVDFEAGVGVWHCWGEWSGITNLRPYDRASIFGKYYVLRAPAQLL